MIPFNRPPFVGDEINCIEECIRTRKLSGDGAYTAKCSACLKELTDAAHVLLTTSCTHALEMAAILTNVGEGDEVIMPSFTFVSTADAFVLRGAKVVFVDIRPDTMNIDESKIEEAVNERTKVIVPVHYAGVGCEMDAITEIADRHGLKVVEDAAQGIMASYKGRALGSIGDFGCFSFHETKNISMGEGGALLLRDESDRLRAEIIREKGTNRSQFFRGEIDKYTWMEPGSSYLPSELNAAYLWGQLQHAEEIIEDRMRTWNYYHEAFSDLKERGLADMELPVIPEGCRHNAHIYYIKAKDLAERTELLKCLSEHGVHAVFHYVPLHTSPAGQVWGRFIGEDRYTTKESDRLIRLPLYYGMTEEEREQVAQAVKDFYSKKR